MPAERQYSIPDAFLIKFNGIDAEHGRIVETINECAQLSQNGILYDFEPYFEKLHREISGHFEHEEALMASLGFDGLKTHMAQHQASLGDFHRMFDGCRKAGVATLHVIDDFFHRAVQDIAMADLKFAEFLTGIGKLELAERFD